MKTLDGASVLLLEDEYLIALDAELILKDLGAATVQTASNLADDEKCAQEGRFDLALAEARKWSEAFQGAAKVIRDQDTALLGEEGK